MNGLMKEFAVAIDVAKQRFSKDLAQLVMDKKMLTREPILSKELDLAESIIKRVIKGTYRCDSDGEKLFYDDDHYTKMSHASSGQQESVWILLFMFLLILQNREVFIVFEEPEAHLYPEGQQEVVHLISLLENALRNQVIITTHSPYILSSMNNLIYAHIIGQTKPDETRKILDELLWLDPDWVGAYFIDNGEAEDIIDLDNRLIKAEKIDSASRKINQVYVMLFDLDDA